MNSKEKKEYIIRVYGDPVLRKQAEPLTEINDDILSLIGTMSNIMDKYLGIGLAAPQVGRSIQLIVVDLALGNDALKLFPMINPEIIETSGSWTMEEGCLSVPDIREKVIRPQHVHVRYVNTDGNEMEMEADDLLGRVILHEVDHLNGILFVDRISSIKLQLLKKSLRELSKNSSLNVKEQSG